MSTTPTSPEQGLKLKEICDRLDVDYDDARYVLAAGVLPDYAAESTPGRGNHRTFDDSQALMLAVILKLRAAGVSTAVARKIADWPKATDRQFDIPGWDRRIAKLTAKHATDYALYLEVGDSRWIRSVSHRGITTEPTQIAPWIDITTRRIVRGKRPSVIFRIDIVRIAQQLYRLLSQYLIGKTFGALFACHRNGHWLTTRCQSEVERVAELFSCSVKNASAARHSRRNQ